MPARDRDHDQVENAFGDHPAVAPAADPRSWTAETVGDPAGWTHPLPDALIAAPEIDRRGAGPGRRADHRPAPDRGREGGPGWVPGRREARPGAGARLRRPRPAAGRPDLRAGGDRRLLDDRPVARRADRPERAGDAPLRRPGQRPGRRQRGPVLRHQLREQLPHRQLVRRDGRRLRRPALPEDGAVRGRQPGRQRPGRRRGTPPRTPRGARRRSAGPSTSTAGGASGSGRRRRSSGRRSSSEGPSRSSVTCATGSRPGTPRPASP